MEEAEVFDGLAEINSSLQQRDRLRARERKLKEQISYLEHENKKLLKLKETNSSLDNDRTEQNTEKSKKVLKEQISHLKRENKKLLELKEMNSNMHIYRLEESEKKLMKAISNLEEVSFFH